METVGDRIARAQAQGDLAGIRAALLDARASGADPAQIEQALAEVSRLERLAQAGPGEPAPAAASPGAAEGAAAGEGATGGEVEEAARRRLQAEVLKKRGNERLKDNTKSAAREAMECFTAGLEVQCSDNVLNAQLYGNRAHVRMLLRQFVEAVDDCRKAIELDPKNIKAYWRAAKASIHLDLHRSALQFCEAGLEHEPQDPDLQKLRATCSEKLATQQQRRSEMAAAAPADRGDLNVEEAMQLEDRLKDLNEQIEGLRSSMLMKQRERLKAALTRTSVTEAPAEARLYSSVGRCFLMQDRPVIEQSLNTTIESLDADLPKMSKALQELEKRRDAAEAELKEMVQAFRQQAARGAASAA